MRNGIECLWHRVCADILQKQGGISPLLSGWMRREMKSSETSRFVTREPAGHIRRFGAQNAFWVPALYPPLHYVPSPHAFLSLLINWVAGDPREKGPYERTPLAVEGNGPAFLEHKGPALNVAFSSLPHCLPLYAFVFSSSFCFLNLLRTKNRKVLPLAWRLCLPLSLTICLCISVSCV